MIRGAADVGGLNRDPDSGSYSSGFATIVETIHLTAVPKP